MLPFFLVKNSLSATQGTVDRSSSQGTAQINIGLESSVRISNIEDTIFGSWDGIGDEVNSNDLCIYANGAGGSYGITVTGSGPNNSFQVSNGSSYLNYYVTWNDKAGTNSGERSLVSGALLANQTNANTISIDCSGGTNLNSRLTVTFLEEELSGASTTGSFTGDITIAITPQ